MLACTLATAWALLAPTVPRTTLYLQPLGAALPDADVALVATALRELYGLPVRSLPRVDLPPAAYYAPRKRWRAEKLLPFLAARLPQDGVRVIGLTGVDISTSKGSIEDWGVLGLGEIDGGASVISSFRCARKANGPLHARQRLAKVAVHEVGHTLGLDHCTSAGCLMHDAEGRVTSTDQEYDLCARCRRLLRAAGHVLPDAPRIPWPHP